MSSTTPTINVIGNQIIVSGDFAWFEDLPTDVPIKVIQGTILTGKDQLASYDGVAPIIWEMPVGTYSIRAFGYPSDRMNPNRTELLLTAIVSEPTRPVKIKDALLRYSVGIYETQLAKSELLTLSPTKEELREALI